MNCSTSSRPKPALFLTTLLGTIVLASCGAPPPETAQLSAPMPAESPAPAPAADHGNLMNKSATAELAQEANQVPQSRPQLVKTAEIALIVNSIDDSLRQASQIVKQQQGDILGLQDDKPQDNSNRQTALMQIRVPQDKLETTLDALAKLGTLQRRNLGAEDVSDQLVDFQARLRNLRETESSLLKIMNRSGSVGDVLKVAQELSEVRQSIEQIDAQLKNLTNRVAYSTITLHLEAAVSTTTSQPPLGIEVQNTWKNATQSVSELTTDFVRLGVWLLAYSPYLLLLGGATLFGYTRLKKQPSQPTTQVPDSNLSSD